MSDETTTEMLAEIEGQAADYTPPEGWRVLQAGELLEEGDEHVSKVDNARSQRVSIGNVVPQYVRYIRRIEQPEPEPTITQDDDAAEVLAGVHDQGKAERQAQVEFLKGRLQEEKAVNAKRLQQVEELRSEVSHVQRLWGESRRRVEELETLVKDLRAVNAAQEKGMNSAARDKADLQHRLDTVAAEWAQQAEATRQLQIELDAREQVPQSVSDRFEEGWDAGTARAVETIAEWTEAFRTCGSQGLSYHVMQNLPHIMRTLTGLTDED